MMDELSEKIDYITLFLVVYALINASTYSLQRENSSRYHENENDRDQDMEG